MLANNTNDSIPAWKVPLLERRRQQAEFERQSVADDSARLAQMPAWKREVYLKKRMQKNDDAGATLSSDNAGIRAAELARKPAFRNPRGKSTNESIPNKGHSRTRDSSEPELTSDSELSDSERLLPIQRNPILQSDLQRRPPTVQNHATSSSRHGDQSLKGEREFPVVCNGCSTSGESDRSRPLSRKQDARNRELNEQEEVTYGRGFVNKLLGRFRELSENNHAKISTSSVPKRYRSSDNLLNDSMYDEGRAKNPSPASSLKYAKGKAQSMENLTTWNADEKSDSLSHRGRPLSVTNGFSMSTTPSNIHSSEQTGKRTLTVSLVSKSKESADVYKSREPAKSREPVDVSRSMEPTDVSKSRDPVKSRAPADVYRNREPADMFKSREQADASKRREPVDVSRSRGPVDVSRSRGPVDVSRSREPADVSRNGGPADDRVKGSVVHLTSPSEVVCETSPRPEDELPRSNIVLLTRTVFESIGTSPPIDMSLSRKRSTLPMTSKSDDPRVDRTRTYTWEPETLPDSPDGHFSSRINSNTLMSNGPRAPSTVADLRPSDIRTASLDRKSRGFEANIVTKTSERDFIRDNTTSFNSEKSSSSKNVPGSRESAVDSSPSPVEQSVPIFSGSYEKSTEKSRNGLISSQVVQMQSRNGESLDSVFVDFPPKTETPRQHLILDLKDLPILAQAPVQRPDRSSAEKQSSVDGKNRKKGPGSLLIRPASNLLASSTKVEYLNLTKYNDVKTGDFAPPNKRPLYYDDDDTDYSVPVTNLDSVMGDDDARFSPKEGDPSVYKSHTPTFEFEGAGVRFGRSLLVKSKDTKKMRIRFDDAAEKTFEYPSEQSTIEEWIDGEEDEEEERRMEPGSSLKHTPGIGSSGSLSSYKSRLQVDYEIGLERPNDVIRPQVAPSSPSSTDVDDTTLMSDDTATWSNSASSDLLF